MILCTAIIILTMELVMATNEQCSDFQFKSPFLPGESCEGIYDKNPESQTKPGYYWILSREYCGMTYTGSSCEDIYNNNPETSDKPGYYRINDKWTYCNMKEITSTPTTTATTTTKIISTTIIMSRTTETITLSTISPTPTVTTLLPKISPTIPANDFIPTCAGVGGGWRRIVNINIRAGDKCPIGWREDTYYSISFCRVVSDNNFACSSANFSTNGTSYQRVCGRARGYQKGRSSSFAGYSFNSFHIDHTSGYADGLLITYGSPRNHIWSYVNGLYDRHTNQVNCPCASSISLTPPPFVGTDYYCESGVHNHRNFANTAYYFNDPLWDGSGCSFSRCCDNTTQPWFYRQLSGTTTSDIEARICHNNGFNSGSTLIDQLELYIQ